MVSFLGADDARIQSDGTQSAEESGVLDLHAAVHHHLDASLASALRSFFVNHAQLHPDHFRSYGDGFLDNAGNVRGLAKNIHDFDGARHVAQRRVRPEAKHFFFAWIYRCHIVTFRPHVDRGEVAGAEWIRGQPHHSDALVALQNPNAIRGRGGEPAAIDRRIGAYAVAHYPLLADAS